MPAFANTFSVSCNLSMTIPQKEQQDLYESLFILFKCKEAINNLWLKVGNDQEFTKGFERTDTSLLYYIILETVSYCEEYDKFVTIKNLDNYKKRIKEIKNINKPIFSKIRQWKLKEFRNNIVAHTWRRGKEFAHPDSEIYNVPKNPLEFKLLVSYIDYSWQLIEYEFSNEFIATIEYMLSISDYPKRVKDYSKLNDEQISLVVEVNKLCLEYKKDYFLKVFLFDFAK